MNKKFLFGIGIILSIVLIFLIGYYSGNTGKNISNNDNGNNDKTIEGDEENKNYKDRFDIADNEIKTKKEIEDIINDYKSHDNNLTDEDIADKLAEDHGDMVGRMYSTGLMVDEKLSEEDNSHILTNLYYLDNLDTAGYKKTMPVKEISNPINGEFGNVEENKEVKVSDIGYNSYELDKKSYVKNTKGFYNIEGLNIGYPYVGSVYDVNDGEITTKVTIQIYIDEDIKKKDLDSFFGKYKNIDINGKGLDNDKGVFSFGGEFWEDYSDDDYAFFEHTILTAILEIPLNELYDYNFETYGNKEMSELNDNESKEVEKEVNKAFGLDKDNLDENPKLKVNDQEVDMVDYIIKREGDGEDEESFEKDFKINPVLRTDL